MALTDAQIHVLRDVEAGYCICIGLNPTVPELKRLGLITTRFAKSPVKGAICAELTDAGRRALQDMGGVE
jgi:hypothetical protein